MKTANPGYGFQTGETIKHLLVMVDLKLYSKYERTLQSFIQTGKIFSEDIGMQFRIDKCKKGKIVKADGTELPNEYKQKKQNEEKCKMREQAEKSVNHVLKECSKFARKEHKRQHDWFETKIHWEICRKYGIEVKEK